MIACREALQQAGIFRRLIESIMSTVGIADRCCRKIVWIDVVERGNRKGEEPAVHEFSLAPGVGADAACLAEVIVQKGMRSASRSPLILRLSFCSRYQPEPVRLDEYKPRACLGAD